MIFFYVDEQIARKFWAYLFIYSIAGAKLERLFVGVVDGGK